MKLSDYKNEAALDLMADLLEPATEIIGDPEVKRLYQSGEPKTTLVAYILRNHKTAIIEVLARIDGQDPGEYTFTFVELPMKVLELLNDPAILDLFITQSQTTE